VLLWPVVYLASARHSTPERTTKRRCFTVSGMSPWSRAWAFQMLPW
jgi:hypothetical protein